MTKDLVDVMDTEKVDKMISIGHDWGSACAACLYNYYRDCIAGTQAVQRRK
jgi:pimeloyl-ACP methyl ester carboxylesterase